MNLTPLGTFHPFLSVVAVVAAFVALARSREISTGTRIGQFYLVALVGRRCGHFRDVLK